MDLRAISQALSLVIQCATIITLIYTLIKFTQKPTDSIKHDIDDLKEWRKDVDRRLDSGSSRFTEIDAGAKVTQEAILALIDHAIDNNHTDKLIEAKDNLQKYLINK